MVFGQRGQRVVFKFEEQQFDLEVPAQVDGEGRDLAIAVPSDPESVREPFLPLGLSRLGFFVALTPFVAQGGKARLLRVFPPEAFLFSFVIDPNGEVPSGLIQLTEDGAVMQVRPPAALSSLLFCCVGLMATVFFCAALHARSARGASSRVESDDGLAEEPRRLAGAGAPVLEAVTWCIRFIPVSRSREVPDTALDFLVQRGCSARADAAAALEAASQ